MDDKLGIRIAAFLIAFLIGGAASNFANLVFYLIELESRQSEALSEPITSIYPVVESLEPQPEIIEEIDSWVSDPDSLKIKLLTTGEGFHGDEVKARNGERWLGVFELDGRVELRETKLRITRVFDEIVDEPRSGKKTGKTVRAPGSGKPLFLVKNARFPQGELKTVFLGRTWEDYRLPQFEHLLREEVLTSLLPNTTQNFSMSGERYELKVFSALNPEGKPIYALALESSSQRQILHTIKMGSNYDLGTLFWIGDIDQDGKPDLFMDLFEHYNVVNSVLFLSSEADDGQIVKKAAYFWTTGC